MFENLFNGMFGPIPKGICTISMTGQTAILTSDGTYKCYDLKTDHITIVRPLTMSGMDGCFFVVPTNRVKSGDIIVINSEPKVVTKKVNERIEIIDPESNEVKTILPERHVFMGKWYCYAKIVNIFGNSIWTSLKGGSFMKMMILQKMMNPNQSSDNASSMSLFNGNNPMMQMMMMQTLMGGSDSKDDDSGIFGGVFDGLFDLMDDENDGDDMEPLSIEKN